MGCVAESVGECSSVGKRRWLTCLSKDSMTESFWRICARRYSRLLTQKGVQGKPSSNDKGVEGPGDEKRDMATEKNWECRFWIARIGHCGRLYRRGIVAEPSRAPEIAALATQI